MEPVGLVRLPFNHSRRVQSENPLPRSQSAGIAPMEIFAIQGNGESSPLQGQAVETDDNVVTAVFDDGFFIQTPGERSDGDDDTSDGIFVEAPEAVVAVGDLVDVDGTVAETFGFTRIKGDVQVIVESTGHELPTAVQFDAGRPSPDPAAPSCAIEFECYEGMLIEVKAGVVTGPSQRFSSDTVAEAYVTAASQRTFREPGIEFPGLQGLPVWDGNPEVFELDPDKLGLPNQALYSGSTFSATGVLGYEFGGYELWPISLEVISAVLPSGTPYAGFDELSVASLNLFRLLGNLEAGEYQRRLDKLAEYILDVMKLPDVLAVSEVGDLDVLEDLAQRIEGKFGAIDGFVDYTPYLEEGNDFGGINVGFLVKQNMDVDGITQLGAAEIFNFDGSALHDRPPLLLEGSDLLSGFSISVLAVHNRSLGGIDDPGGGERVRRKRLAQAQSIAEMVQAMQAEDSGLQLVVIGDFNAFEFSDGYVDVVGQVEGTAVESENLHYEPNLVEPPLLNAVEMLPAHERYSFVFQGNAEALDHALLSASLESLVRDVAFARGNADAPVELVNDGTTVLRASDHDGLVLLLSTGYQLPDGDSDGVPDEGDMCPNTAIPERVPTEHLAMGRYALTKSSSKFRITNPSKNQFSFSLEQTAGCSCEQIITQLDLGNNQVKYGCRLKAMREWVSRVGGL